VGSRVEGLRCSCQREQAADELVGRKRSVVSSNCTPKLFSAIETSVLADGDEVHQLLLVPHRGECQVASSMK
jgi:hypothetical protein